MEMLHDEGDAGPEQQLISQQPRYLLYVVFQSLLIDQRVVFFLKNLCDMHVRVWAVKLRHTCILNLLA